MKTLRRLIRFFTPPKPLKLPEKGNVYDLREMYEQIKEQYFSPDYNAAIGWSNRTRVGKFRAMTFGTYDRRRHQIRISRLLDDERVPRFFVEFIVYHEMLHAVCLPTRDRLGRVRIHTPEFKQKEEQFPHFVAAQEWRKNSLTHFKKTLKVAEIKR
ncbi:MAG: SprT-like domain-containing protein [Verrucomicrobiota bacterium]|nr:SprT-like domain-containing protein [Verrucomicrobiota bacterium]